MGGGGWFYVPKVRIPPALRGDVMCGSPLSSCAWARRSLIGDGTSARSAKQHEKERLGLVPGLVSVVVGAAADPFDGYQGQRWRPNSPMVVIWDIGESCLWPEDILGRTEDFWSEILSVGGNTCRQSMKFRHGRYSGPIMQTLASHQARN